MVTREDHMELTEDELADATANWWNNPITIRTGNAFVKRLVDLNIELRRACAASSDPAVAAAYARVTSYEEHVAYYKGKRS
jgi:hypothetical protein